MFSTVAKVQYRHIYSVEKPYADGKKFRITRILSNRTPKCGTVSQHQHGTYERKAQDLPILGKSTWLLVNTYEYQCDNPDFICTLALETSCEGCSRICKSMNLKTSGDSVICLLTKRYKLQEEHKCSSVISVDDFAFKRWHAYGTIIVDEATHKPVAILDGRDGSTLKEWLAKNKHVKTVTRFHLHQNLLEAIKNTVNSTVPADIKNPKDYGKSDRKATSQRENESKKIPCDVDNFAEYNEKRVQLYNAIHEYDGAGYSKRAIAKMAHCGRNTATKYLNGDYESLCRKEFRSGMDHYPQLKEMFVCIRAFREIYQRKNMPLLYLFIEKYKNSTLKEIARFAKGLEKDISAVENSVASPLSSGFVEGTNNKLKMVKRTMYGRSSKLLLAAKLMCSGD